MPNNIVMLEEEQLLPRCVPLGTLPATAEVIIPESNNTERLNALEERVLDITNTLDNIASVVKILLNKTEPQHISNNKNRKVSDIPNDTILIGKTKGTTYYLHIYNNNFYVGAKKYESLSAAAEGVSGTRRSGFVFWTFPDGKTVKDFLSE